MSRAKAKNAFCSVRTKKSRLSEEKRPKVFQSTRVLLSIGENHYSRNGQDSAQLNRKVNREVDFDLAHEA
jgi:hypothetical protein